PPPPCSTLFPYTTLFRSRLQQIDTRQGTNNRYEFGHGNTLPYTGTPFGMNHFVLMSRWDDVRFYHPEDVSLFGIRLTHQPSPWIDRKSTRLNSSHVSISY